jgi:hypothetical protein
MPFKKGKSGNVSGRPIGAKDKTQQEIKDAFKTLIESNLEKTESWLSEVAVKDPARALELLLKLAEFVIPKLKSVEAKLDFQALTEQQITDLTTNVLNTLSNETE